jgi:uncharacterized protein (TIGR02266 family)
MSRDKREHSRAAVNADFQTVDEFVSEYVSNISKGGVFIRAKDPIPVGTEVDLKFSVWIGDDHHMVEGLGRVVHNNSLNGQTGMGVTFTELTDESRALIDRITAGQSADFDAI